MNESIHQAGAMLSVCESTELDLPAREAWDLIADFGRVEDWHPAVARTEAEGPANTPGTVRRLRLLNGAWLEEQLSLHDPQAMQLAYTITAGEFPVSGYSTELSVRPGRTPGHCDITWSGHFRRADLSANPPPGQDDEAAIAAVRGVYTAGLQALRQIAADRRAIREVIRLYAEGGTRGDPDTVARAFHPSATMKFVREGRLVDEPIEHFLAHYIQRGVQQQRQVWIDRIDLKGTAGSARLTIDYATHQFVDYFNLLKIEGRWLVVSKIFHRVPK